MVITDGTQSLHGVENTALIAESQQAAIERIAEIVTKHRIDCDFTRINGYMFQGLPSNTEGFELDTLQSIYKAISETQKIDVSLVDDANIPGLDSGKSIRFGQQATFHPTKYVRALAQVVTDLGGVIFERSHMNDYEETERGVRVVMVNGHKVIARDMVMATNVPLQKVGSVSHTVPNIS